MIANKTMSISCYPHDETQLRSIVTSLQEAGFSEDYEEEAHGEKLLLTVHARTFDERERVREILRGAGIFELIYSEDTAA
jgi:hypothetical protein